MFSTKQTKQKHQRITFSDFKHVFIYITRQKIQKMYPTRMALFCSFQVDLVYLVSTNSLQTWSEIFHTIICLSIYN